jgi:hypothetical protein
MSATIDVTESAALAVLRGFLLSVLPTGVEVIRGQQNQTPLPAGPTWGEITPMVRRRLGTNVDFYDPQGVSRYIISPSELTVQTDFYGPSAGDYAQIIAALWRDRTATEYCQAQTVTFFLETQSGELVVSTSGTNIGSTVPVNVAPLFAGECRQTPFVNDQAQYEYRWSTDLLMQINPTITVPQQYFDNAVIGLINVDAAFPA